MNKLLLIDGNSMIFKAYYATAYTGNLMISPSGVATNALYAMANMILKLLRERKATHVLVAFDKGKGTFRHNKMPEYKANRNKTPKELRDQFVLVKEFLNYLGIAFYEQEQVEADDIIGTFAKLADNDEFITEIFSSDKDFLQLISEKTTIFLTKKGVSDVEIMDQAALFEKWAVNPEQVPDLKGLMGDPSDNIPGLPGVGEKTAIKLLTKWKTIENLIKNKIDIKGKLQEKLIINEKLVLLCKEIATIKCDVVMELKLADLKIKLINKEKLGLFLHKHALNSILKKLNLPVVDESKINFKIIKKLPILAKNIQYSINVEVFDENYNNSFIVGISISNKKENYYITLEDAKKCPNFKFFCLSNNYSKIVFGLSKITNSLRWAGFELNGVIFDSQLASYLINHKIKPKIIRIEKEFSDTRFINDDDYIYGKGVKKRIPEINKVSKNSCLKSSWLLNSINNFTSLLSKNNLKELYYDMEFPLAKIIANMEFSGITVKHEILDDIAHNSQNKLAILEAEIFRLTDKKFNISSPSQLAIVLFDHLELESNQKRSTAQNILEYLSDKHRVINYIILHRKYSKLLNTYAVGLKDFIKSDGKIHSVFSQTLTQTGRLSSRFPNLQNITIKDKNQREIRKAFVVPDGYVFASFDYSQIELRILAHLANDTNLINAFKNDIDIHLQTAATVFKVPLEDVSASMRNRAKAVNFGIIYGISDFGLSKQLSIPMWEAKQIINNYNKAFPTIIDYQQQCINEAMKNGYIKTMFGRKRNIPELQDNKYRTREFGKRAAINAPIQGTASDIIKLSMVRINQKLLKEKIDAKLVLQIHDELIYEVKEINLNQLQKIILKEMENVLQLKVPLKINSNYGKNLYQAK